MNIKKVRYASPEKYIFLSCLDCFESLIKNKSILVEYNKYLRECKNWDGLVITDCKHSKIAKLLEEDKEHEALDWWLSV